jgi:hypothetical protein
MEDDSDNLAELMNQMREMRDTLSGIENTKIEETNLNELRATETERNNEFFELVFSLQRIARELTSIATANKQKKEELPVGFVDAGFIARLTHLDKVKIDEL